MSRFLLLAFSVCALAADRPVIHTASEPELRRALALAGAIVELPRGALLLHRPLEIPGAAKDLEIRAHPQGSVLTMAGDFQGRAAMVASGVTNLRLTGFAIRGNRDTLRSNRYLPPGDTSFADFYPDNGILLLACSQVTLRGIALRDIRGFSVLVNASSGVTIEALEIEDCGTLNDRGRNNTTGGILLEDGSADFTVRRCRIRRVPGNAIWTHSYQRSPRNRNGAIADNVIDTVARDAIQIGHATSVRVERNQGSNIGFPAAYVDTEGAGIPVAVDTGGNVDQSAYLENRFTGVNGQCIDLDGFHDGEVTGNSCVNRKPLEFYPNLHYGIVFGNTNPAMTPARVLVSRNRIEGFAYGGVYVIGTEQRIVDNELLDLNRAHCTGDVTRARCNYAADQPGLLRSGIYLGNTGGRPAETDGNVIRDNVVTGYGMDRWCIGSAPGVELARNTIAGNRCAAAQ